MAITSLKGVLRDICFPHPQLVIPKLILILKNTKVPYSCQISHQYKAGGNSSLPSPYSTAYNQYTSLGSHPSS